MRPSLGFAATTLLFATLASSRTITATVTVTPEPLTVPLLPKPTGYDNGSHRGNFSLSYTLSYPKTMVFVRTSYPVIRKSSSSASTLVSSWASSSSNDTEDGALSSGGLATYDGGVGMPTASAAVNASVGAEEVLEG